MEIPPRKLMSSNSSAEWLLNPSTSDGRELHPNKADSTGAGKVQPKKDEKNVTEKNRRENIREGRNKGIQQRKLIGSRSSSPYIGDQGSQKNTPARRERLKTHPGSFKAKRKLEIDIN